MDYHHGKFVWFEYLSRDIPKASAFYDALFGWHTETVEIPDSVPYPMIHHGGHGIGGFREAPAGTAVRWMPYLSVPDVDVSFREAITAGANPLMPPIEYGTVGCGALLADPTGAEFVIWKSTRGDPPDVAETAIGDWYWNELLTTDESRARLFYETAFGFTSEGTDMGPMGTYYLLKKDGKARAGLMRAPQPADGSSWLPYVRVADCDGSAAKAQSLGARIAMPPRDIAGIGRFSVLIDPLGAAIAVMRGQPAA
jgi:predicted enzyme related to lactoylglutathione lyase